MAQFTLILAQQLFVSEDQFPVDLDAAWKWCGYTDKRHARETLNSYMVDGVDFRGFGQKATTGRPSEDIRMTLNCFKELGMLAKSEQGRLVRKYFLECERIAKTKPVPVIDFSDPLATAKLYIEAETERRALTAAMEQAKPKVEFSDSVATSINSISIQEFAEMHKRELKLGRNQMFKLLREMQIIQQGNTLPYAALTAQGYFEVGEKLTETKQGLRTDPFCRITGKGQV